MQHDILIPKVGMTMTEATLIEWLVEEGTVVAAGDPVLSIETDKSTLEVDAPATGRLHQAVAVDTTVEPGAVVGSITVE